ncbi:craniofacial development protein 2-like [Octopus sinensis]|uniref:Craniofacial development protein 2-like n=1 Tax=Octopus sinensis TaxID=2607531 RepID=A0A6P7U8B5_9MOLL|nr:craniofacial development protein 2-like [Octopus sinensis]
MYKQLQLTRDLEQRKVSICCLQETKITEHGSSKIGDYTLITLPTTCRHYGLGFAINRKLDEHISRVWSVSDRIAVLQIKWGTKPNSLVTIINVYAPTGVRALANPDELDEFYSTLTNLYNTLRSSYMCFIAGDWNARAGKARPGETCIGSHGRNRRNVPGTALIQFCTYLDLFLCNTAFRHPARHKTTWTGTRKDSNGNYIPIFNQIDYILCKAAHKHLLVDSRSYGGLETNSDHKLVITSIGLYKTYNKLKKLTHDEQESYNLELFRDEKLKQNYADKLQEELDNIDTTKPANAIWDAVTSAMKKTAVNVVGLTRKKHKFPITRFAPSQKGRKP